MARAEDRYVNLEVQTLPNGRQVYRSARPKNLVATEGDLRVVADEKDRLDIIANNVYGDANEWWRLAAINGRFKGSLHTKPNLEIIVPLRAVR